MLSSPQLKAVHPKGMEVVANVIETCGKEAGQKLLLNDRSCKHGYLDEPLE
jgi:hypothetical protein